MRGDSSHPCCNREDPRVLRAEGISRVGQGRLAALTSSQVVKMALIGVTSGTVVSLIRLLGTELWSNSQ